MELHINTIAIILMSLVFKGWFDFRNSVSKIISKITYNLVSIIMIIFLRSLEIVLSGFLGLFLMSISTVIGIISQNSGVKKVHVMGVLTIPTILNF